MSEPYRRLTSFYQNISGTLNVAAATTTTTLVTGRTDLNETIFLQKVHVEITTGSSGKTWTFQDSNGTPVVLVPSIATDSVAHFDFDFGPNGIPCTQGKNLVLSISAAGAVGWVSWEGYQKRTAIAAA